MGYKIVLDNEEYQAEDLSANDKKTFVALQFADLRLKELTNMQAILQRAKNSYIDSLKEEVLSQKAGLLFEEE